jgi:hypothetical protein
MYLLAPLSIAAALWWLFSEKGGGGGGASGGALTPLQSRALSILDEVVPSAYPDARWMKLGFIPDGSDVTSCGVLPAYLGHHLGDPTGITRYGVEGARTEGQKHNAWIVAGGSARPSPGDIYGSSGAPGGGLKHVGCLVSRRTDEQGREIWKTADAGQGSKESPTAAFVDRYYDPKTNRLTRLDGGDKHDRYVEGWIALARWPFPKPGKKLIETVEWVYPPSPCDGSECR